MRDFPKIALARLRAKPETVRSAGTAAAQAGSAGAGHPDANLLAAFAEKTLTEKERTQVLNHLSECADCRAVASFVLPEPAAVDVRAPLPASPSWYSWRILRWGALAAVLGTLTLVVILPPGKPNRPTEIAQQVPPPPVPTGNPASQPQAPALPPVPATNSVAAKGKAESEAAEFSASVGAEKKAAERNKDLALMASASSDKALRQGRMTASPQPPVTVRAENVVIGHPAQDQTKAMTTLSAEAAPASPSPSTPAPIMAESSRGASGEGGPSRPAGATPHATTQNVVVAGVEVGAEPSAASAAKAGPRATTFTAREQASSVMASRQAFRSVATPAGAVPPAARWSVSADGQVQRSIDGGNSFASVRVADGAKFKAIAALGNDVWAGGSGGALFHSADGGATWVPVAISSEGKTVAETIVRIALLNPTHVAVTTDSGSQWVSEDSGQHWQKRLGQP